MKKVILIFGASSGIGLEVAKHLTKNDAIVYNASRTAAPVSSVFNLQCDVTQDGAVETAVQTVLDCEKRIDAVVYSAGYSMAAPIEYVHEEDYRYLFDVNFFGALRAIKAVVPSMRNTGGKIILNSSLGSVLPIAFDSFYSASKAALDMLARAANIELNPYGITVTGIQIGPTSTRFTFKRNVYADTEVGSYGEALHKATVALAGMEQGGMTAEESAQTIIKVLESDNPPILTGAGWKNKALSMTEKLLPVRLTDLINKNQYL